MARNVPGFLKAIEKEYPDLSYFALASESELKFRANASNILLYLIFSYHKILVFWI